MFFSFVMYEQMGGEVSCPRICFRKLFVFVVCHHHSAYFQRQTEQVDETVSVFVVVQFACGEACHGFVVQAVRRSAAGRDDVAFIQFQFNGACYSFVYFVEVSA